VEGHILEFGIIYTNSVKDLRFADRGFFRGVHALVLSPRLTKNCLLLGYQLLKFLAFESL
jgi:hypothetical protein